MKTAEQLHRIPDRTSVNHYRRRCDENSNQRIERHRSRQTERLPDHLLPLTARKAGEVRNVERDRCPEADCRIQRRNQELQEPRKTCKSRGRRQHWTKTAPRVVSPRNLMQRSMSDRPFRLERDTHSSRSTATKKRPK